jgi:4-amino-4-deoxy-L-arabinose transferase-like glycosyltransferase
VVLISWHRWGSVVIDGGREMNLPLRILNGETLYSEVYHLYGPFAPYFNAFLYMIFGVHLNTLYTAGLTCTILILLMVFEIGRHIMPLLQATLATLAVMVLCVFKQGGHTIFPYAYSALYGTTLALAAFLAQLYFLKNQKNSYLTLSGLLIGLSLICKQEYGFAAMASAFALIVLAPKDRLRIATRLFVPAIIIPVIIYGILTLTIPASALFHDTFFFPGEVPPELIYFNMGRLGMDYPAKTIFELVQATVTLMGVGGLIGLLSIYCVGLIDGRWDGLSRLNRILFVTIAGLVSFFAVHLIAQIDWFISPIRALPVLCGIVIVRYMLNRTASSRLTLLMAAFSVVVLARQITRVSSGGAYSAFMLPVPLVLFTYLTTVSFPKLFATARVQQYACGFAVALFICVLGSTAWHITKVYIKEPSFNLQTSRGSIHTRADVGPAFVQALNFIAKNTSPTDYIFAAPEGSSLNFLGNRRVPLRYEILIPGFLNEAQQAEAIKQLKMKRVKFIFILNRPTPEFGPVVFGKDYGVGLMNWIADNYELIQVFGNSGNVNSEIGDHNFFIKCYRVRFRE